MKTAISVPDDVFRAADVVVRRLGWTRSQLYARVPGEFLERQGDDPVTSALDSLADELSRDVSPGAGRALIDAGAREW